MLNGLKCFLSATRGEGRWIGHDVAEKCRSAANGNPTVDAFWEAWVFVFVHIMLFETSKKSKQVADTVFMIYCFVCVCGVSFGMYLTNILHCIIDLQVYNFSLALAFLTF
jgi:hypothetical protein